MLEKESDIQKAIIDYLRLKGHKCWKARAVGIWKGDGYIPVPMLERGVADIIGLQKDTGRLIAVEVKRKGNKPTNDQQLFIDEVNRLGGIGIIAYSVDDLIKKGV